jgi:hypothetical protein
MNKHLSEYQEMNETPRAEWNKEDNEDIKEEFKKDTEIMKKIKLKVWK